MMCNNSAVSTIVSYIEECLFVPGIYWSKYEFEKRSYSHWAAYEILGLIMDHPLTPPDDIVYEFMLKMVIYSEATESKEKRFIFSTARDTAEDILSLLEI